MLFLLFVCLAQVLFTEDISNMNYSCCDEILIGGVLRFHGCDCEEINILDYVPKIRVKDIRGREILVFEGESLVVDKQDNSICSIITSDITAQMRGLYFVKVELWFEDDMIYSNEVEKIYIS